MPPYTLVSSQDSLLSDGPGKHNYYYCMCVVTRKKEEEAANKQNTKVQGGTFYQPK